MQRLRLAVAKTPRIAGLHEVETLMTDYETWSTGQAPDATPDEVLESAQQMLAAAADHRQPTLIQLDPAFWLGWNEIVGYFRVAGRIEPAPDSLPAWLAAVEDARHIHAGGDNALAAAQALEALVLATAHQACHHHA